MDLFAGGEDGVVTEVLEHVEVARRVVTTEEEADAGFDGEVVGAVLVADVVDAACSVEPVLLHHVKKGEGPDVDHDGIMAAVGLEGGDDLLKEAEDGEADDVVVAEVAEDECGIEPGDVVAGHFVEPCKGELLFGAGFDLGGRHARDGGGMAETLLVPFLAAALVLLPAAAGAGIVAANALDGTAQGAAGGDAAVVLGHEEEINRGLAQSEQRIGDLNAVFADFGEVGADATAREDGFEAGIVQTIREPPEAGVFDGFELASVGEQACFGDEFRRENAFTVLDTPGMDDEQGHGVHVRGHDGVAHGVEEICRDIAAHFPDEANGPLNGSEHAEASTEVMGADRAIFECGGADQEVEGTLIMAADSSGDPSVEFIIAGWQPFGDGAD